MSKIIMNMITIYKNNKKLSDIKFYTLDDAVRYFKWNFTEWFESQRRKTHEVKLTKFCGPKTKFFFRDENGNIKHCITIINLISYLDL